MRDPMTAFDGTSALSDGLTAEGYYRLPNVAGNRDELVAGEVIREPMPSFGHGAAAMRIARVVDEHVARHRLGIVLSECGYVVRRNPDTVRGPDASFVSSERLAAWDAKGPFFEGAPDLAVEVLSPSNTRREIEAKLEEYLAAGAREVWVVDPDARRITVHRPGKAPHPLGADDTLDGGDVLPGLTVPVAELLRVPSFD